MFDFLKKNRNEPSSPSDNTNSQKKSPFIVSELGKARYTFEHQVLKDQFFSNTRTLLDALKEKNVVYDLAVIFADTAKCQNPYKPGDITVNSMRVNSSISFFFIEFPNPDYAPLCYRIYLFFSDDYTNLGYYTIECGVDGNAFICGWDHDTHLNCHELTSAEWDKGRGLMMAIEANVLINMHAERLGLSKEKEEEQEVKKEEKTDIQREFDRGIGYFLEGEYAKGNVCMEKVANTGDSMSMLYIAHYTLREQQNYEGFRKSQEWLWKYKKAILVKSEEPDEKEKEYASYVEGFLNVTKDLIEALHPELVINLSDPDPEGDLKASLYHIKKDRNEFYLDAEIKDGSLEISGYDIGPFVAQTWGDDDYEYWYCFDRKNTERLFEILVPEAVTNYEKLLALKGRVNNVSDMAMIKELCSDNGIEFEFHNYA